jgi:hypothetical protein
MLHRVIAAACRPTCSQAVQVAKGVLVAQEGFGRVGVVFLSVRQLALLFSVPRLGSSSAMH